MRKLIILFVITISFLGFSFKSFNQYTNETIIYSDYKESSVIQWLSFQDAVEKANTTPKKIIVDIYTQWCVKCKQLDKLAFTNPVIVKYVNENFYPVKLDAEMKENINFKNNQYIFDTTVTDRGVHQMAIYLTRGKLTYPSLVFLDENMSNPQPVAGVQNPANIDRLLKFFGEDYYKKVDWGLFKQIYQSPFERSQN